MLRRTCLFAMCLSLAAASGRAQGATAQPALAPPPGVAVSAVVPVVISARGANGASYHTAVQAYNPSLVPLSGVFLFRAEANGAVSETTLPYAVNPGETLSFVDILDAMGQRGLGSLDIIAFNGTEAPVLSVRVYNDADGGGTNGFTEEARRPEEALTAGSSAVLVAPFDAAAYRLNVGVRTFDGGGTIRITVRDQAGTVRTTLNQAFAPNAFTQMDAATFLQGLVPESSDTITIEVLAGSLFVYGATADNHTGDPAIALAQRVS